MTGLLSNYSCLVLTDWRARRGSNFKLENPKCVWCLSSITAEESCEPGDRQPWASKKVRILTTSTYLPATRDSNWIGLLRPGWLLRLSPVTAAFSRTMVVAGIRGEQDRVWIQVTVIVTNVRCKMTAINYHWIFIPGCQQHENMKYETENEEEKEVRLTESFIMMVVTRHWGWQG